MIPTHWYWVDVPKGNPDRLLRKYALSTITVFQKSHVTWQKLLTNRASHPLCE
jgi:hypothetical protein